VMRYESDVTATVAGAFSAQGEAARYGSRSSLEGRSVLRLVHESRSAARIDDFSELEGEIAEIARSQGIRSAVGSPIVVAGHLWGAVVASSTEPLPEDTGGRLGDFTELLASAIANAESREGVERLADEQAALRRIATLVAQGAPPQEVFAAVVEEVGGLLPVRSAAMGRYHPDGTVITVAAWSTAEVAFPIGRRSDPEGDNVTGIALRTGHPARVDDFSNASGPIGVQANDAGHRSAVGSPIKVEDRLWGVLTAASTAEEPLPADTEARLARFAELVAIAIARAESRDELALLADEQAALRRAATLVVQGAQPAEIFSAISDEVEGFFGVGAAILRFEHDPPAIVFVSVSKSIDLPTATRW